MAKKSSLPPSPFGYYDRLQDRERRFIDEYLIDLNAYNAATRAGYSSGSTTISQVLLNRPEIQGAIKERREMIDGDRAMAGAKFVLNKLWDVATADPRDLVAVHRVPCRYCHGINGQYQFTQTEMDRLLKAHEYGRNRQPFEAMWPRGPAEHAAWTAGGAGLPFDPQGGNGYTTDREPNPGCSECHGTGTTVFYIHDTRRLSVSARALYRGVKWGKQGIEVLLANQDGARDMLAKHYGVAVERRELVVRTIDPNKLTDEELASATAELEALLLDGTYTVQEPRRLTRPTK